MNTHTMLCLSACKKNKKDFCWLIHLMSRIKFNFFINASRVNLSELMDIFNVSFKKLLSQTLLWMVIWEKRFVLLPLVSVPIFAWKHFKWCQMMLCSLSALVYHSLSPPALREWAANIRRHFRFLHYEFIDLVFPARREWCTWCQHDVWGECVSGTRGRCQGPGIDVPSTRERFSGTRGGVSGTKERSWTRDVSETRERCVRDQRKLSKGPGWGSQEPWWGSQEPWWGYQGPGWGYQWPKEGCHETGSGTRERCVRDKVEVVMEQGSGISPHQKTLYVSCYSK